MMFLKPCSPSAVLQVGFLGLSRRPVLEAEGQTLWATGLTSQGTLGIGVFFCKRYFLFSPFLQQPTVPLVSRVCPSDVCRIWKSGAKLRVDITLLGFENMSWERGKRSLIFRGEEGRQRGRQGLQAGVAGPWRARGGAFPSVRGMTNSEPSSLLEAESKAAILITPLSSIGLTPE